MLEYHEIYKKRRELPRLRAFKLTESIYLDVSVPVVSFTIKQVTPGSYRLLLKDLWYKSGVGHTVIGCGMPKELDYGSQVLCREGEVTLFELWCSWKGTIYVV